MIIVTSLPDAFAVIDCTSPTLEPKALYVGNSNSHLVKVDTEPAVPTTCDIGEIREFPGNAATFIPCDDVAIDHSTDPNGDLYCVGFGNTLYKLDRTANFVDIGGIGDNVDFPAGTAVAAGTGDIVKATKIGNFINIGGDTQSFINAFEIDLYGEAYIAAGGNEAGKFYNLDLTTAVATLRSDFNTAAYGFAGVPLKFVSSGDLARDESTSFDIYWTAKCEDLNGNAHTGAVDTLDEACLGPDGIPNNGDEEVDVLYLIKLGQGPGGAGALDSLTRIDELPKGGVFAMELIQPTFDLCFLTTDPDDDSGDLFETDRTGLVTRNAVTISPEVNSFGAAGNSVGGIPIMINVSSLAIAAAGIYSPWLLLFAVSGAAVIAYQFTGKSKTRKKIKV